MLKSLKNAAIAASLGVATLMTSATAEARDHWRHRGNDDAAIAIGAGVLGLAVGAAIASDRGDRYDRRYYRSYPRGYYYDGYPRYREYYYRDYPRYRNDWRYDRRPDRRHWRERDRYYRRGW